MTNYNKITCLVLIVILPILIIPLTASDALIQNNTLDQKLPVYVFPTIIPADQIEGESFSNIRLNAMPKIKSISLPNAPAKYLSPLSPAAMTYYGDRPTFEADHPGTFKEDFENTLVPDFGVIAQPGPWDSATNNACFAPGGILDGIRFIAPLLIDLAAVGDGAFTPTAAIGPNGLADDLDIILLNDTYAVGFDIYLPFGSGTLNFSIHGPGDAVLAVVPVTPATTGTFWGVSSDQPITRIRTVGGGTELGELIDNVTFGNPKSVLISGYVKDSDDNGIEGVAVEFSNGGATVFTYATGHYSTSVAFGWNGTSTATKDWWNFTPESLSYPNHVTTHLTDQNYMGTAIPVSYFISGHIRDINRNGIEGVAVEFSNGSATVFTNATGHYSTSVAFGWNGYSIATKDGWTFTPNMFEYPAHVEEDFFGQDFVGRVALAVNDIFDSMPTDFTVLPAYPNPFNPSTTISYGLDSDSYVTLEIYDISGKLITTLQNENQTHGWHSVQWNGTNSNNVQVPAGIYLSKVTSNTTVKTTKLMLLK